MTLSVRGNHVNALPDALGQITVLALPTLPVHLHQRLERIRQARQVCLCSRKRRRQGRSECGEAQRHSRGGGDGVSGGRGGVGERG